MALIAVYGGIEVSSKDVARKARAVGAALARHRHELLTGAAPGVSYYASAGAKTEGGCVMGFSAAVNEVEHETRELGSLEHTDKMFYTRGQRDFHGDIRASFKYRNILTARMCDAGIVVSGKFGTLNELTLLCDFHKIVGVLEETGGTADIARNVIEQIADDKQRDRVVYDADPESLVGRLTEKLTEEVGFQF